MNRRQFVRDAAFTAVMVAGSPRSGGEMADAGEVRVRLRPEEILAEIPSDFLGLGYEISSVARRGLLSAGNSAYVQMVRTLAPQGVIRVGGNTSDYSSFAAGGQPVSSPKGTVVNNQVLRDLGGFLDATRWSLIWGLNLGSRAGGGASGDGPGIEEAVAEAKVVSAAAGSRLLAMEIGNEPDLFVGEGHRKGTYGYAEWYAEWKRYRDALRKELPDLPLAGPDVAGATDWVTRFATDEGRDVRLLTHHYYREGQNQTSTLEKLLRPDPKLAPELETLRAASKAAGLPYRICEVNSFSGGGRPGVSDTFGAALWVLEYLFELAAAGCAGVNLETGVNQRGFVSSYSPIKDDERGHYRAAPEFYGMLAFAQGGKGRVVRSEVETGGKNVTVYATRQRDDRVMLTVINKEAATDVEVEIGGATGAGELKVLRLTGPAMDAKTGVMLGGAAVAEDGTWRAGEVERVVPVNGRLRVTVPRASAAIVGWR